MAAWGPPIDRRQWLTTCGGLSAAVAGSAAFAATGQGQVSASSGEPVASRWRPPAALGLPELRSCLFVFYYGGPSQLETWDPKPTAPSEIRGEFSAIETSVPGISISEHLPRMACVMQHVAVIRSMHHQNRLHDSASIESHTGRPGLNGDREEFNVVPQFYPSLASAVAWGRGPTDIAESLGIHSVHLPWRFHNVVTVPCQGSGFLGEAYEPLGVTLDVPAGRYRVGDLEWTSDQSADRLASRQSLLSSLGHSQGTQLASTTAGQQWDRLSKRAQRLMQSTALQQALDLSQEPQSTRDRYGYGQLPATIGDGGRGNGAELGWGRQHRGQNLLVARRLVEAGVPFINVHDFRQQGQNWDAHFDNFRQHSRYLLPIADQSLSALIADLEARGLLETTLVVALGEFGRTPRINAQAGRDHWPDCYSIVLAGGGVQGGTIYGASDAHAAYPARQPVSPADLAATIFWRFGLDPEALVVDRLGRPQPLSTGEPLLPLFGVA